MPVHILNLGSDSANFYLLISGGSPRLLVDCGWPNSLEFLRSRLHAEGYELTQIGYLLVTHYHPDHSGLAKELKAAGVKLLVFESQQPSASQLADPMNLTARYIELQQRNGLVIAKGRARAVLEALDLKGDIIPTIGHSEDSVSLVLDEGIAFTGDLPSQLMLSATDHQSRESWKTLEEMGVKNIYPGHGKKLQLMSSH